MKRTVDPQIESNTTLARLRALLDEAERGLLVIQKTPTGARDVIRGLDQIDALLDAAREQRLDVRAEEGRADFVRRKLESGAPGVVRLVQAADMAGSLKDSPAWEGVLAAQLAQSKGRVRRLLFLGLPVLAVMLTIIVLTLLYPPAPAANLNSTRNLAQAGKLDEALQAVRGEAARVPTDPQAQVWIGVLLSAKGDAAGAEAAYAEARRLFADDARFTFERGTTLLESGRADEAEPDARTLIANPQTEASGYLLLGGVEELRGNVYEASQAFQKAADLARASGNAQLEVIAKTRQGYLMQSNPIGVPTPTP